MAVRVVAWLVVVSLVMTVNGCADNKGLTIHGTVSYQKQPVAAGILKIHGPGDRLEMAYIRNGSFRITDVIPGEIRVTVEPDSSAGKTVAVPKKYSDVKTSGLVFMITATTRELPIALE
jgi:hypothetical protein